MVWKLFTWKKLDKKNVSREEYLYIPTELKDPGLATGERGAEARNTRRASKNKRRNSPAAEWVVSVASDWRCQGERDASCIDSDSFAYPSLNNVQIPFLQLVHWFEVGVWTDRAASLANPPKFQPKLRRGQGMCASDKCSLYCCSCLFARGPFQQALCSHSHQKYQDERSKFIRDDSMLSIMFSHSS